MVGIMTEKRFERIYADVDVEYHHSDYSEYDQRTCMDGGDYGYDYYVVTKIHEVGELW